MSLMNQRIRGQIVLGYQALALHGKFNVILLRIEPTYYLRGLSVYSPPGIPLTCISRESVKWVHTSSMHLFRERAQGRSAQGQYMGTGKTLIFFPPQRCLLPPTKPWDWGGMLLMGGHGSVLGFPP